MQAEDESVAAFASPQLSDNEEGTEEAEDDSSWLDSLGFIVY